MENLEQITQFLESIKYNEKKGHIRTVRTLNINNNKINLYLGEHHEGGTDGIDKTHTYTFNKKDIIPSIIELKNNSQTELDQKCEYKYYYDLWDQMYHEIDEHEKYTQSGILKVKLYLENNKLQVDSINFIEK